MPEITTHYDNLQVTRNASDAVIRSAYRALSQQHHPDKNAGRLAQAERRMKLINKAYFVLSDPTRRVEHNSWIDDQTRQAHVTAAHAERVRQQDCTAREKDAAARRAPVAKAPTISAKSDKAIWLLFGWAFLTLIALAFVESATAIKMGGFFVPALLAQAIIAYIWRKYKQASAPLAKKSSVSRINVLLVLLAGCAGGALALADGQNGAPPVTWLERAQSGFYWGAVFSYFLMGCACTVSGWVLARAVPILRPHGAKTSFLFMVVFLIAMLGGQSFARRAASTRGGESSPAVLPLVRALPQPVQRGTQTPAQQRFDVVVAQLEREYPQINPDSPLFRPEIIAAMLSRKRQLIGSGVAPEVAVRQAVEEGQAR